MTKNQAGRPTGGHVAGHFNSQGGTSRRAQVPKGAPPPGSEVAGRFFDLTDKLWVRVDQTGGRPTGRHVAGFNFQGGTSERAQVPKGAPPAGSEVAGRFYDLSGKLWERRVNQP